MYKECCQIKYCISEEEPPSKILKKDQDLSRFSTRDLLTLARQELDHDQLPRWVGSAKICGCCLGSSSSDANEIVECDGCGISVHEGCYGINETAGSVASTVSSASTEPWLVKSLTLEATPSATPFFRRAYKISHLPRL